MRCICAVFAKSRLPSGKVSLRYGLHFREIVHGPIHWRTVGNTLILAPRVEYVYFFFHTFREIGLSSGVIIASAVFLEYSSLFAHGRPRRQG